MTKRVTTGGYGFEQCPKAKALARERAGWLREHPGGTRAEYDRMLRDDASEVSQ